MAGAGNVIVFNGDRGILFAFSSNDNAVEGNWIGTNPAGTAGMGNATNGVEFIFGSSNNTVGGTAAGAGNVIANNGGAGVALTTGDAQGDAILSNSIYGNAGTGITLAPGANQSQSAPVLGQAIDFGPGFGTAVKGSLSSVPSTTFTIQFFASPTPDPSGSGQGQIFLGSTTATTDATGSVEFQGNLTASGTAGDVVSATATDPSGDTSVFSVDIPIATATPPAAAVADHYDTDVNTTLNVPAPGILSNDLSLNGVPFFAVLATGTSHGKLTLNANGSFTYKPNHGFTGVDTFTYEDRVGTEVSQPATVTINVNPKTFVVTNINDSGTGSLRWAITNANLSNSAPPDEILFDIPGNGPFTITPNSPLPAITHATIIDAYSEPGASPNTLAQGDNAVILVSLSGAAVPTSDGLTVTADGSTIRGLDIGGFNNGIHIFGNNDLIAGNYLGTDVSGTTVQANSTYGLLIDGSQGNTVGGTSPAARNLISGNGGNLVLDDGATANLIEGNYVGTDASGTRGMAGPDEQPNGIMLLSAPGNTVGGNVRGAGNLISGVADAIQILLFGSGQTGGTLVQGNLIGTNATGTAAIGNSGAGISIEDSSNNIVGGTSPGAHNIISANGIGILFLGQDSTDNLIQGNYIGLDITGRVALGNGGDGILVSDSNGNTFGGTVKGAGNIISANGSNGIELAGGFASNNLIQGNFIGTDNTGTRNLGNVGDGVLAGVSINTVGGTHSLAAVCNVIAFNGGTGVGVPNNTTNGVNEIAILSNSIFANANLGIDLGLDGVTFNHLVGTNSGPNNDQNFPVLDVAARQGNSVNIAIKGSLTSTPSTTFTLQYFANPAADPSGFGQGQNLIGTTTITTNASGFAAFQYSFKSSPSLGGFLSATATDPDGNTSEFSADVSVAKTTGPVLAQDDEYDVDPNHVLNVVAPGVQTNDISFQGGSLTSVLVAGPAHGSLALNSDGSFTYTPNTDFRGLDTFTYNDLRGNLKSNVATVTINVNPIAFTVTTTSDSGAGSLRSAIMQADAFQGSDIVQILFAIPGSGPFTISPSSPLPVITHSVTIDGYSQTGAAANSLTDADNASIQVILDGSVVGGDGLAIAASNCTIEGLAIDSFSNGIHLLPGSTQNVVAGNFIGLDSLGSSPLGNSQGILVDGSDANTIGGTMPADRNLVAANSSENIFLTNNASTNLVVGNFVGLSASGTSTVTSPGNGVVMDDAADNTVGGTALGAGNVIAGQGGDALQIIGSGGNVVQGNLIGTDPTGAIPLGDGTDDVGISGSSNNLIGGTAPGAGNTLAAGRNGIFLDTAADDNVIQGNASLAPMPAGAGLGNTNSGIAVFDSSSNNVLGGTVAGAGNVIVLNGDRGILFAAQLQRQRGGGKLDRDGSGRHGRDGERDQRSRVHLRVVEQHRGGYGGGSRQRDRE